MSRLDIPPFAAVTSAAGLVIVLSGTIDALTSTGDGFGSAWTWAWTLVALAITAIPVLMGDRFVRGIGLVGAAVFLAVTSLQMALSTSAVASVNNLVLYPMIACYLGWFFSRPVARLLTGAAFAASGAALLHNPYDALGITWLNLGLASGFCLEAAGYLRARLDHEVATDPLTGVRNRSGLDERIDAALARAARTSSPLTIAIIDLDDFKRVNDEHGHEAGDRLLVDVATTLRHGTRSYDQVARIGGDEFLVLLPGLSGDDAGRLLARLRQATAYPWSYGVAESWPGDTSRSVRDRADQALYEQKQVRKQG